MSLLWEKSETWRWLVRRTRDSRSFFFTFATVCGVVPGVIGYCVMQATNSRNPELELRLRQTARPDSIVSLSCSLFELRGFVAIAADCRWFRLNLVTGVADSYQPNWGF
ncbi:hypothetical protein LINPERPRIM_LOCUS11467 [Linum perenne]